MKADGLWIGQVAMAALINVSFAFAIGSALFDGWLRKDARQSVSPARAAWLRAQRSMRTASFVLALALVVWLVYESASISGNALPAAFAVVPTVLGQTHVGFAWLIAFGGALLLVVAAFMGTGSVARDGLWWLAVVIVAAGRAGLGHAIDAGVASAALGVHTLHVLSVSVWGGLVLAGGLTVLPALGNSTARGILIRTAQQLSALSFVTVFFVLATGAFNAVRGTGGSLDAFTQSTWGHVLLLKLALVALALVLGGANRLRTLPSLRRTASTAAARRFVNVLYLEALVMLGIFIVAAALAHSVPGYVAAG